MYLRGVTPASQAGHEVPPGAFMECNLEYLQSYESRETWMRYGHTAYLGPPSDESCAAPGALLGIWCCHQQQLVLPGDALWEHAKLAFRASICFSVTAKDHLMETHWLRANGLHSAARETLGPDHPLRRLLKQYYYGSASINLASKDVLMPVNQLAHRAFALSAEGWVSYFNDLVKNWKFESFPEWIASRGLPESFVQSWPVAVEGLAVWRTFESHICRYLKLFYSGPDLDDAIRSDNEIAAFWHYFESDSISAKPWNLPELGFDSLVTLVTDLIWWCTAGHEFVGAIVEYLVPPRGLPTRVLSGHSDVDVQSYAQSLVVIALTGVRKPPLLGDYTHLFQVDAWPSVKGQAVLDEVRNLQFELAACADEMDDRNEERQRRGDRKFVAFNPRILETSVSI